jgi:DNA replication protein DnaC
MANLPICFRFRPKEEIESYMGTYEYYSLVEMAQKSNLPVRAWQDLTIGVPKDDLNAYRLCNKYKDDVVNQVSLGQGLFIYGGVGSGKTVWSYKIARHYLELLASTHRDEKSIPVYFANVPRLLDELRVAMRDADATKSLDHKIMHSDLVIFDDIGAENATQWAKDKLYQYIDYRYANAKACIFTSNVELEALEPRIADRINGSCTQVEFTMESKRKFGVLGGKQ